MYLVAVVDWFSRKVLAWRLSITIETAPCVEALSEALARHGRPEIMNTDQGSQFTSVAFLTALQDAKIAISMDGKGAWPRQCLCRTALATIKYEEVYLRAYRSVSRRVAVLVVIWRSYNRRDHIHRLAGKRPIKPMATSPSIQAAA